MSVRRAVLRSAWVVAVGLIIAPAAADDVVLKDGRTISGDVRKTDDGYVVREPAGDVHVAAADVYRIDKASPGRPGVTPRTPATRATAPVKTAVGPAATRPDPNDADAVRRVLGRQCTFQYVSVSHGQLKGLAAGPVDTDDVAEAVRDAETFRASTDAATRTIAAECHQITLMNWRFNRMVTEFGATRAYLDRQGVKVTGAMIDSGLADEAARARYGDHSYVDDNGRRVTVEGDPDAVSQAQAANGRALAQVLTDAGGQLRDRNEVNQFGDVARIGWGQRLAKAWEADLWPALSAAAGPASRSPLLRAGPPHDFADRLRKGQPLPVGTLVFTPARSSLTRAAVRVTFNDEWNDAVVWYGYFPKMNASELLAILPPGYYWLGAEQFGLADDATRYTATVEVCSDQGTSRQAVAFPPQPNRQRPATDDGRRKFRDDLRRSIVSYQHRFAPVRATLLKLYPDPVPPAAARDALTAAFGSGGSFVTRRTAGGKGETIVCRFTPFGADPTHVRADMTSVPAAGLAYHEHIDLKLYPEVERGTVLACWQYYGADAAGKRVDFSMETRSHDGRLVTSPSAILADIAARKQAVPQTLGELVASLDPLNDPEHNKDPGPPSSWAWSSKYVFYVNAAGQASMQLRVGDELSQYVLRRAR